MLLSVLSVGLFIAGMDNHYWTVFASVVWFDCTQTVARDPSKPLAEIKQHNCVFVESQRAFCSDWDGGCLAFTVTVGLVRSLNVCL